METFYQLDNDMLLICYSEPNIFTPGVVGVEVFLGVGSDDDPVGKEGLSHFLEHMVCSDIENRFEGDQARQNLLRSMQTNAYTSPSFTCYESLIHQNYLNDFLKIYGHLLAEPSFAEEAVQRESRIISKEILPPFLSDAAEVFTEAVLRQNNRDIGGTLETVATITNHDLLEHWQKYYTADNAIAVIFGNNIDHHAIYKKANQTLGKIRRQNVPQDDEITSAAKEIRNSTPALFADGPGFEIIQRGAMPEVQLVMSFESPINEVDPTDLKVLSTMLSGRQLSPLFSKLRTDKQLVYDIKGFISCNRSEESIFLTLSTWTDRDSVIETIHSISETLVDMALHPDPQTVEIAKRLIAEDKLLMRENRLSTIHRNIARYFNGVAAAESDGSNDIPSDQPQLEPSKNPRGGTGVLVPLVEVIDGMSGIIDNIIDYIIQKIKNDLAIDLFRSSPPAPAPMLPPQDSANTAPEAEVISETLAKLISCKPYLLVMGNINKQLATEYAAAYQEVVAEYFIANNDADGTL